MTSNMSGETIGILPRAIDALFEKIESKKVKDGVKIDSKVTFMEIYNEDLRDLLSLSNNKNLSIREKEGSAFVDGLTEAPVATKVDIGENSGVLGTHLPRKLSNS